MKIRQEESTPIGDFFHDSGLMKIFNCIRNSVDEFEVDTDELSDLCDRLASAAKMLKGIVRKAEAAYRKHLSDEKISGLIKAER